jgi:transcriptional regulator with XRE-family HTH domain
MINGNLLKGRIVSAGMSQKDLATILGMSENTLSAKIRGASSFTVDEVERCCDVLHIVEPLEKCEIFLAKASQ